MNIENLTIAELETLLAARKIMERSRSRARPAHQAAPVDDAPPKDWTKITKTCAKCGDAGAVVPMFGTITQRGVVYPQSWCARCRATTNYRGTSRVNKTKHNR